MGIQDFFKSRAANQKSGNDKPPVSKPVDTKQDTNEPNPFNQKFQRSSKTIVSGKSNLSSKKPLIDDDDDEIDGADKPVNVEKERGPKKTKATAAPLATVPISSDPHPPSSSPTKSSGKRTTSNYQEYLQRKAVGPTAPGSKEIPQGSPNCLVGLTFVLTGELSSLSREDAQDLIRRYGGRITGAPSRRTDYVVVGEEPGPSKMKKVEELGLCTLNEDGLLDLVRSSLKQDNTAKPTFSSDDIVKPSPPAPPSSSTSKATKPVLQGDETTASSPSQLWSSKYAPQCETELIGNHANYDRLLQWLQGFGDGTGVEQRAVLISGPPGIGKTTAAHLACHEAGRLIVEMNASDARNRASLHDQVRVMIDNRSVVGWADTSTKEENVNQHHRKPHTGQAPVLIMDEVDGMSAGDRGGMAELIQLIKKTRVPIICICNDRSSPKVRSLANYCLDLRFRRPDARAVLPRLTAIAQKEGLELGVNVVEELVQCTHGDIRQMLNILSTYRLTETHLDFDTSKRWGTQGSRKDVQLGPFDAVPALLGGASYDRMSLAERIDMYFVDSSLVPLMIHENYIHARATTPRAIHGAKGGHSWLKLYGAAAESLSESDLVEGLIRGANQEWSLAPLHAVMSSVRPAYYCHGSMSGRIEFASWLGNYSKGQKNQRLVGELTRHTYLQTLTSRKGLRLNYLPWLAQQLLRPLLDQGGEGIELVVNLLDDYDLTKEDFDSILELMVNPKLSTATYTRLPPAVKTALTRKYNQGSHKLPYAVGGAGTVVVKKVRAEDLPAGELGAEAALDEEEMALLAGDRNDSAEDEDEGDEQKGDISKDKMIKSRSATSATRGGRGRGRGRGKTK